MWSIASEAGRKKARRRKPMAETDLVNSPTASNPPAPSVLSAHTIPAYLAPVPTSHFLRAWERQPRPALSRSSRTRTVWKKKWDLDRSVSASSSLIEKPANPSISSPPLPLSILEAGSRSPAALRRVVKRRCIVLEDASDKETFGKPSSSDDDRTEPRIKRTGRGTSWERRESGRFRKRHIIGEKQLFRLCGTETHSSSPLRSPLKVASSLAHQGLSFSSPTHQAQKEQSCPLTRPRSSSVDLLPTDGREIASTDFMSMSDGENMHLSGTIPDKATFWNGTKFSIAANDKAEVFDFELCKAQKKMISSEGILPVKHPLNSDAIQAKSKNEDEYQALKFEEADHELVIHTEGNVHETTTDKVGKGDSSDEFTIANSHSKPKMDMHLVLDTALLRDFLDRAAANKEKKREGIAKQSSLLHRRDSDAVRNALGSGSPTKALGERDTISPPQSIKNRSRSPNKDDSSSARPQDLHGDVCEPEPSLSEVNTAVNMKASSSPIRTSRRSSRVRNSRVSQNNSEATINADNDHSKNEAQSIQSEKNKDKTPVKKTAAQELAQLTRRNSNKNKRGALPVSLRLVDLAKGEEYTPGQQAAGESQVGAHKDAHAKTVTWAENLVQYPTSNEQVCIVLKKVSYSTPKKPHNRVLPDSAPSSSLGDTSRLRSTKLENRQSPALTDEDDSRISSRGALPLRKSGVSTPRARRVRGLGTSNGTPAKGLLSSSLSSSEFRQTEESSSNKMENPQSIERHKKLPSMKREKQRDSKGTLAIADNFENRHVSKLVPPKVTGLAGLGIGKVSVPTPKSSRRK